MIFGAWVVVLVQTGDGSGDAGGSFFTMFIMMLIVVVTSKVWEVQEWQKDTPYLIDNLKNQEL